MLNEGDICFCPDCREETSVALRFDGRVPDEAYGAPIWVDEYTPVCELCGSEDIEDIPNEIADALGGGIC